MVTFFCASFVRFQDRFTPYFCLCASFFDISGDGRISRLFIEIIENYWWPEVELNHRHTDFQSVALPTELSGLGGDRKVFFKHMNILDF